MREILFRGKRLDNGEWIYGYYAKLPHPITAFLKEYIVEVINGDLYLVEPETIGQFTGLLDKNGKKIFEGDILKTVYTDKLVYVIYNVENTSFEIYFKNHSETLGSNYYSSELEIVGNIHDNKELLK